MDLQDFLARVLPGAGLRVICHSANKGFQHVHHHTDLEAAETAAALDAKGHDVYFACASYKTADSRKASNVHSVKSFWLDLDAGPDKPYANGQDAAKAALIFAAVLGIPRPLLVASGVGIHAYWPMESDVEPEDWRRVAEKLKVVTTDAGLHADPKRTADIASVLRPPGTHHRKTDPKPVKVIHLGEALELDEFEFALDQYITDNNLSLGPITSNADELNDDLSGGMVSRNCDAEKIASKCAVIGKVRDTRGCVDQPTWYHTLQILAYCENGEHLAHEWSNGYPGYTQEETSRKFEQASQHKPTLCKTFSELHPDTCRECPYANEIKSPISLHHYQEAQVITTPAGVNREVPKPYIWMNGKVWREHKVRDGDGWAVEHIEVTDTLFYFIDRYNLDEEGMAYQVEYVRQGQAKYFTLTGALISKGGSDLLSELGKHEIVASKPHELHTYLKTWMAKQRELLKEKRMHQHFGWQDNGEHPDFLLGDKLYRPKLGMTEVLLKGGAKKYGRHLGTSGDYDRWKYIIDRAYNHPGLEGLQFLVLCGFAAPLFAMFGELGGITVYAYSGKTGKGKSTACQAALSAWGNYRHMMTAHERTTVNAFWEMIGTYHTLPVLYDELTNITPESASQLVFGMTDGQPKHRLKANGEPLDNNSTWRTILLATGNNQLSEKLVYNRANPEAEIARIFEFPAWAEHEVDAKEAASLFRDLLDNYGYPGVAFAQYITDNRSNVVSRLLNWRECVIDDLGMSNQERYWSALISSVLCALEISKKLGILKFSTKSLYAWISNQLTANRGNQTVMAADPNQHFSRMLADLASGIIESQRWGNLVKGELANTTDRRPTGPIVGRLILDEQKLYLSVDAVRRWCVKHKISATEMIKAAIEDGWVDSRTVRESLGRGTEEYASVMGRMSVHVVDMTKINAVVGLASGVTSHAASGGSN